MGIRHAVVALGNRARGGELPPLSPLRGFGTPAAVRRARKLRLPPAHCLVEAARFHLSLETTARLGRNDPKGIRDRRRFRVGLDVAPCLSWRLESCYVSPH